ncbi:hypothetical protein C7A09_28025, partial [Pseudomonas fluorescens]
FLLLYLIVKEELVRKWVILVYHILVANPMKTIGVILLMLGGVVKAREINTGDQSTMDPCFLLVTGLVAVLMIARREPATLPLVVVL